MRDIPGNLVPAAERSKRAFNSVLPTHVDLAHGEACHVRQGESRLHSCDVSREQCSATVTSYELFIDQRTGACGPSLRTVAGLEYETNPALGHTDAAKTSDERVINRASTVADAVRGRNARVVDRRPPVAFDPHHAKTLESASPDSPRIPLI